MFGNTNWQGTWDRNHTDLLLGIHPFHLKIKAFTMSYQEFLVPPNKMFRVSGQFAGYGTEVDANGQIIKPARVWVARVDVEELQEDTIIRLTDASGNKEEILASEPGAQFDYADNCKPEYDHITKTFKFKKLKQNG